MQSAPATNLGRYKLIQRIGVGGMHERPWADRFDRELKCVLDLQSDEPVSETGSR